MPKQAAPKESPPSPVAAQGRTRLVFEILWLSPTLGGKPWPWFVDVVQKVFGAYPLIDRFIIGMRSILDRDGISWPKLWEKYWINRFPGAELKPQRELIIRVLDPAVFSEKQRMDYATSELKKQMEEQSKAAPKIKVSRTREFTDEQRIEMTARRFLGESLSSIANKFKTDKSRVSTTVSSTCARLEIDTPK